MKDVVLPRGMNDVERDWMDDAYCRLNRAPIDLFFLDNPGPQGVDRVIDTYCANCSVTTECLNYALNNHISMGIFGGKSGRDRRILQRKRKNERSERQGD